MGCSCKNSMEAIAYGKKTIEKLRELFIKRMTVNSSHQDRRRKDYNQAIFAWWSDEPNKTPENTFQVWAPLSMDMVLKCFDDAAKDWRRLFCDVESCTRR